MKIKKFKLRIKYCSSKTHIRYGIIVIFTIILLILAAREASNRYFSNNFRSNHVSLNLQRHSRSGNTKESNRRAQAEILCYVLLSKSRIRVAQIIKETWGSHCDALIFFGGFDYPDPYVTRLNITEGYENLWGKAKAAVIYLSEHPIYKKFQFYMKADDDTFVIVENLREFVTHNAEFLTKPAWFGYKLKHPGLPQGYMSGGAGYVFNNAALLQVLKVLKAPPDEVSTMGCKVDEEYGIEDLEIGKCFLSAGVKIVESTDADGKERFLPVSYEAFLNGAIPSFHWIWRQSWNRVKTV